MSAQPNKPSASFTSQQRAAINGRGNLLVVAGAGTGKTRTLVARCLRLISEEHASFENILMVTFTEAAAAEMRARLRKELSALQAAYPDSEHLAQQLALLDTARICTLHSFCLQLAREHFHELGLDPQFGILDEQQTHPLMRLALDELLERHYSGTDDKAKAVKALILTVGRGSDARIRHLVQKLHAYSQSLPNPARWLNEQEQIFAQPEPTQWRQWLLQAVIDWRDEWETLLASFTGQSPAVDACLAALRKLPAKPTLAEVSSVLRAIRAADSDEKGWPRGSKGRIRDNLKSFFSDAEFLVSLLPDGDNDPLAQDWEWTRHHMATLIALAREFAAEFAAAKRELGGVDFTDLEQCALQLLIDPKTGVPTATAQEWRARLAHIFVDEYQDINAAQDAILTALARDSVGVQPSGCPPTLETRSKLKLELQQEVQIPQVGVQPLGCPPSAPEAGNRFMVGDVKQSIYRFRLANPKIFSAYDARWKKSGADGHRIPLTENFRSRENLINFINPLFTALMRPEIGGVAYEPLQFGAAQDRAALSVQSNPAPLVEFHLIARGDDESPDDTETEGEETKVIPDLLAVEREARLIARRLRALKESRHSIWDTEAKSFRPVQWSDMVVLMRSPSGRAEAFAMEFSRAGVPLVAARDGFYQSLEVSDLISLLKLLDNPLQDIPLLAVLRSPLVGLSLVELAQIRAHNSEKPFWTALAIWHRQAAIEQQQGTVSEVLDPAKRDTTQQALHPKVSIFLTQFHEWRTLVRQSSLSQCLETALVETHYEAILLAGERGVERMANVRRLLDLARQFDPYQRQGLYRFLRFVQSQEDDDLDLQPAPPPTGDAVRLMSIHKSKGLEFPVVALACIGTQFNQQDFNEPVLLTEQYGLSSKITPPNAELSYASLPYWLARRIEKRELRGEELRLLYVALTRARDTLILTGTTTRKAANMRWDSGGASVLASRDISTIEVASARSHLDWLLMWLPHVTAADQWQDDRTGQNKILRWQIYDETDAMFASLATPKDEQMVEPLDAAAEPEPGSLEKLKARLEWAYPFAAAAAIEAKTSVSAIRRRAADETDEEARPRFDARLRHSAHNVPSRSGRLSAADRGIAHHTFLQLLNLEQIADEQALRAEAARLQEEGRITPAQAAALDFSALNAFWQSDLGRRIRKDSKLVRRELEFTARFTVAEVAAITGEKPWSDLPDEFIVVQGTADLIILLPKEIFLIDFKTDNLRAGDLPEKVRLYTPQLKLYAEALRRIHRRPVTGCWLHFLSIGQSIKLEM